MNYKIIRSFPTYIGFTVDVAETLTGEQVVIKQSQTEVDKRVMQDYIRHVLKMQELLGEASVYPTLLSFNEDILVMPFYRFGRIDEVEDNAVFRALTLRAITTLFTIAAFEPASMPDKEERRWFSRSNLMNEAVGRLQRLEHAYKDYPHARRWIDEGEVMNTLSVKSQIKALTSWITDGSLERVANRVAAPSLGLSSHGDFSLSNVLLREPASNDAAILFIDTRARWYRGLPWWDPIFDLATFLTFHCRVEPSLVHLEQDPPCIRHRLSETEIVNLCLQSPAFQRWINNDPHWFERLQLHLAIRLLGNIGRQLTVAPSKQTERAAISFALFVAQVKIIDDIIN